MRKLLPIIGWLIFLGILLGAASVVYSTARGYTTWYFRVDGQVIVDGHKTSGYLHANTQRTILLLTRADGIRPETYLVPLHNDLPILDCGEWHPIRFFPFPVGHVNPPCSVFTTDSARGIDASVTRTLVRGRRSVEFSTISGKRVKAEW